MRAVGVKSKGIAQAILAILFVTLFVQVAFKRLEKREEQVEGNGQISMEVLKITQELVKKRQEKTSFDVRKKVKNRKALDLVKNNQVFFKCQTF